MSRTEEDIESRVDITIVRDSTLRTYPASYSKVCDTFRLSLACARRTDSSGKRFIHFLVPSPVRNRFVRFDAVSVDQQHRRNLMHSGPLGNTQNGLKDLL